MAKRRTDGWVVIVLALFLAAVLGVSGLIACLVATVMACNVRRLNGVKYHLESCTDDELRKMLNFCSKQIADITDFMVAVSAGMDRRRTEAPSPDDAAQASTLSMVSKGS